MSRVCASFTESKPLASNFYFFCLKKILIHGGYHGGKKEKEKEKSQVFF